MALAPRELLGPVVAMWSPALRGLHRLTLHNRGPGGGLPPGQRAHLFTPGGVELLPSASDAPLSELVIDGRPGRKVAWQQAPGAAAAQHGADRVHDQAQLAAPGAPACFGGRQQRAKHRPFTFSQVGPVRSRMLAEPPRQRCCSLTYVAISGLSISLRWGRHPSLPAR